MCDLICPPSNSVHLIAPKRLTSSTQEISEHDAMTFAVLSITPTSCMRNVANVEQKWPTFFAKNCAEKEKIDGFSEKLTQDQKSTNV